MKDAPGARLPAQPRQQLSLLDSTSIIVGIIIGSAIYEVSPMIASNVVRPVLGWVEGWAGPLSSGSETAVALATIGAAWVVGGVLAWIGAVCYAELATTYPRDGGSYVFLTRAFGRETGFAFAWVEFWIVRPGNLGAIGLVFAHFARQLVDLPNWSSPWVAAGAIVGLSAINAANIQAGRRTQNALTLAKVLGLVLVVVGAVWLGPPEGQAPGVQGGTEGSLALALVLMMFAYGGWSDMSYVAAEVREPQRNIVRALVLGTVAVTVLYVAVNLAYAWGLGLNRFLDPDARAASLLGQAWGSRWARAISVLVCVSCLGAMNGMIFTGARIYYALGAEHRLFAWLGKWSGERGVPLRSLVLQGAVTVLLLVVFGRHEKGFEKLVVSTGVFYWGFLCLVGLAVFALRQWDAHRPRPFRAPLYPVTPLVFCLSCAWLTVSSVAYLQANLAWESLWAAVVVVSGVVVERLDRRAEGAPEGITDSNIHA